MQTPQNNSKIPKLPSILVIEDDPLLRQDIAKTLKGEGFNAFTALSAIEGFELATRYKPNLVLCNMTMSGTDSAILVKQLKAHPELSEIPVIFMLAKADCPEMRQGLDMGVADYLLKPIHRDHLVSTIQCYLPRKSRASSINKKYLSEGYLDITTAIHEELLTHLEGTLCFAELLDSDFNLLNPEQLKSMGECMKSGTDKMLRNTRLFLFFSQLQSQLIEKENPIDEYEKGYIFTQPVIQEKVKEIANRFGRLEDLELRLEEVTVLMPMVFLDVLVDQLIDNAFKFSAVGSKVIVQTNAQKDSFSFSVQDSGVGMDAQQIADIQDFKKSNEWKGQAGLGLLSCATIAHVCQGSLHIQSSPQKGTFISILLSHVLDGWNDTEQDSKLVSSEVIA